MFGPAQLAKMGAEAGRMGRIFVHEAKNIPESWNPLGKASWFSSTALAKGPRLQS